MLVPSYDAINTRSILVTAYGHAQFESPTWSKTLEEGERIVTPSRQLGGTLKKIHLDSGWLYPLRWSCRLPIQRGPDMLFFDLENHGFGSILLNFLLCVMWMKKDWYGLVSFIIMCDAVEKGNADSGSSSGLWSCCSYKAKN